MFNLECLLKDSVQQGREIPEIRKLDMDHEKGREILPSICENRKADVI